MANHLGETNEPRRRRATMLRTDRFKYVLSEIGPNLLYDLDEDPDEQHDRLDDASLCSVTADFHEQLFEWFRSRRHDTTLSDEMISASAMPGSTAKQGIMIGYWDEEELSAGLRGDLY